LSGNGLLRLTKATGKRDPGGVEHLPPRQFDAWRKPGCQGAWANRMARWIALRRDARAATSEPVDRVADSTANFGNGFRKSEPMPTATATAPWSHRAGVLIPQLGQRALRGRLRPPAQSQPGPEYHARSHYPESCRDYPRGCFLVRARNGRYAPGGRTDRPGNRSRKTPCAIAFARPT